MADEWHSKYQERCERVAGVLRNGEPLPDDVKNFAWYFPDFEHWRKPIDDGGELPDPDLYKNALDELTEGGGHEAVVKRFKGISDDIVGMVSNSAKLCQKGSLHRKELKSLTIDDLLVDAERALPLYATIMVDLAAQLCAAGHKCRVITCPRVKQKVRAWVKALIKYGGDVTHLVDLVRGTLVFETLEGLYNGLLMIATHPYFKGDAHYIAKIEDRYLNPLTGGYADVQMIVSIAGHLSELQINTEIMLDAKENGGGHAIYDQTRFIHEYVLYSAITNDEIGLREILSTGLVTCGVDLVKDCNGFRALHFAAFHEAETMVQVLLEEKSSPFRVSKDGQLAATLSVVRREWKITAMLLTAMEQRVAESGDGQKYLDDKDVITALHLLFCTILEAPVGLACPPGINLDMSPPPEVLLCSAARLVLKADHFGMKRGLGTIWHSWANRGLSSATTALAKLLDTAYGDLKATLEELCASTMELDSFSANALDICASWCVDSAVMTETMLNKFGCKFNRLRYRNELGTKAWASINNVVPGNLNLEPLPPEQRTSVLAWRQGETGGYLELTYGADRFEQFEELAHDQSAHVLLRRKGLLRKSWKCEGVNDLEYTSAGPFVKQFFTPHWKQMDLKQIAVDVVAFLRDVTPEHGSLLVVIDPLVESGVLLSEMLRHLAPRIQIDLLRVAVICPTRHQKKHSEAMNSVWPYTMGLVLHTVYMCLFEPATEEVLCGFNSPWWQQVNDDAFYKLDANEVDVLELGDRDYSSSVRTMWRKMSKQCGRLSIIGRDMWQQAPSHGALLSGIAAGLQCNLFHNISFEAKDMMSIQEDIDKLHGSRSWIHWFVGNGMEEGRFQQMKIPVERLLQLVSSWEVSREDAIVDPVPLFPPAQDFRPKPQVDGVAFYCIGPQAESILSEAGMAYSTLDLAYEKLKGFEIQEEEWSKACDTRQKEWSKAREEALQKYRTDFPDKVKPPPIEPPIESAEDREKRAKAFHEHLASMPAPAMEASLALLKAAMAAVNAISRQSMAQVARMDNCPSVVYGVFSALRLLLAGIDPSIQLGSTGKVKNPTWRACQVSISSGVFDLDFLRGFHGIISAGSVPPWNFVAARRLKDQMGDDFSHEASRAPGLPDAVAHLTTWVINILDFYDLVAPPGTAAEVDAAHGCKEIYDYEEDYPSDPFLQVEGFVGSKFDIPAPQDPPAPDHPLKDSEYQFFIIDACNFKSQDVCQFMRTVKQHVFSRRTVPNSQPVRQEWKLKNVPQAFLVCVLLPTDIRSKDKKSLGDWAALCMLFHDIIDNLDWCFFVDRNAPEASLFVKSLVMDCGSMMGVICSLIPYPRIRFFAPFLSTVTFPKPVGGVQAGSMMEKHLGDNVDEWEKSLETFCKSTVYKGAPVFMPEAAELVVQNPSDTAASGSGVRAAKVRSTLSAHDNVDPTRCRAMKKPCFGAMLHMYTGHSRHMFGPQRMMPKESVCCVDGAAVQHILYQIPGTENEPPQFVSYSSYRPLVEGVFREAMAALSDVCHSMGKNGVKEIEGLEDCDWYRHEESNKLSAEDCEAWIKNHWPVDPPPWSGSHHQLRRHLSCQDEWLSEMARFVYCDEK